MPSVGEQLRHAREELRLSLEDLAAASHIHRRYLELIENDRPTNLPETYTRAFIRSYASMVGLDPDSLLPPPPSDQAQVQTGRPAPEDPQTAVRQFQRTENRTAPVARQTKGLFLLSAFLILGLIASVLIIQLRHHSPPVEEVPFTEPQPVRQPEQAPATGDSGAPARTAVTRDSLTLEAVATDTVWIRLLLDSSSTREYTLPPRRRMKWKAMNSFLVSVNNAGGIFFTLNGVHLGAPGQGSGPLRNIALNRDLLARLKKPPAKKPTNEKR